MAALLTLKNIKLFYFFMSSDEYSSQYNILKKILNGNIELYLYNGNELENVVKEGKRRSNVFLSIIEFIIYQNKRGKAPSITDIVDGTQISSSTLWPYIKYLKEKEVLISPTPLEFASLTKKIKGTKYYFNNCPKNVKDFLEKLKGKHGTSYKKRFKTKYLKNFRLGAFYLALIYDENGPVYGNCFPESKLNFKKKKI